MSRQEPQPYPALLAAVGQDRQPSFAEMRTIVRRTRLEITGTSLQAGMDRHIVRGLIVGALKAPGAAQAE